MKRSLREVLLESHVAAIAIGMLLVWSAGEICQILWLPFSVDFRFLVGGIEIDVSEFFRRLAGYFRWENTLLFLGLGTVTLAGAWLLAYWVYGVGPIRALIACRTGLSGRNHA